jgi:hypothetical protein
LKVFTGASDIGIGDIGFLWNRYQMIDYTVAIYAMENGFISKRPAPLERYKVRMLIMYKMAHSKPCLIIGGKLLRPVPHSSGRCMKTYLGMVYIL